jgi:hypothetical protein
MMWKEWIVTNKAVIEAHTEFEAMRTNLGQEKEDR